MSQDDITQNNDTARRLRDEMLKIEQSIDEKIAAFDQKLQAAQRVDDVETNFATTEARRQHDELFRVQKMVDIMNRQLHDVWPLRGSDDASSGTGSFVVVLLSASAGSPGTGSAQCDLNYTLKDTTNTTTLGTSVAMTGNGQRTPTGSMSPGTIGVAYVDATAAYVLIWANEQQIDNLAAPKVLTGSGLSAATDSWSRAENTGVTVALETRDFQDTTGHVLYNFTRLFTLDDRGKPYSIGVEVRNTTDIEEACSTAASPGFGF